MPWAQSAKSGGAAVGQVGPVLIRGVHGVDATPSADHTEFMVRKVVIVGFPGVQPLDVVGPYEVFTGASLLTSGGYDVKLASIDAQPMTAPYRPGLHGVSTARPG